MGGEALATEPIAKQKKNSLELSYFRGLANGEQLLESRAMRTTLLGDLGITYRRALNTQSSSFWKNCAFNASIKHNGSFYVLKNNRMDLMQRRQLILEAHVSKGILNLGAIAEVELNVGGAYRLSNDDYNVRNGGCLPLEQRRRTPSMLVGASVSHAFNRCVLRLVANSLWSVYDFNRILMHVEVWGIPKTRYYLYSAVQLGYRF